ncbi:MAG: hypothetical protein QM607_12425 [Microbacterium sp.]
MLTSPPRCELDFTPIRDTDDGAWGGFEVRWRAELEPIVAGEIVLQLPEQIASVPGVPYRTADILLADARGSLDLIELASTTDSSGTTRRWAASRDTAGVLELALRAPVRIIDPQTPVGPLFDLRAEPLGLFGAGVTFIPLPVSDDVFDVTLRWHLADGVAAVSSHGLGDQSWTGPLQTIAYAYYAAGTPRQVMADSGRFGLHAFSEVPFDLEAIACYIGELQAVMAAFFDDPDPNYHVFVRRNPGTGSGGTALPGSFAFGYSPIQQPDASELRSLLAHEMAHNWPRLDTGHSEGAWYTEGTAEYYSHVLPLRAGLLSSAGFAAQLSERIQGYDINPLRSLDNEAAGDAFWADARAQRIPYGRGLRYLIATELQIRRATGGERSLDDVVLDILAAQRRGERIGVDGWLERVSALVGEDARVHYDTMRSGGAIEIPDAVFEGCVRPIPAVRCEFDLGFDLASFQGEERRVKSLVPESAAAAAGMQEGDRLVERSLAHHLIRRSDVPIEIAIMRDGVARRIRYIPSGRTVPTLEWRVVDAEEGQ